MNKKYEDLDATVFDLFKQMKVEKPELTGSLPDEVVMIMQVDGYKTFNRWARDQAQSFRDRSLPIFYAVFKLFPQLTPRQITVEKLLSPEITKNVEVHPARDLDLPYLAQNVEHPSNQVSGSGKRDGAAPPYI